MAGFVAGEGTFVHTPPRRFRFAVSVSSCDAAMCLLAHDFLRVGSVTTSAPRRANHTEVVTFAVQSLVDLVEVVVPFMDEHLPPCHKRDQYLSWRKQLLRYWRTSARQPVRGPTAVVTTMRPHG